MSTAARPPAPTPPPHGAATVPVRVAVVGLGYWGRKLAERYTQLQDALLVCICDHSPSVLAAGASAHPDVPAVPNLGDVWATAPELVVVATEPAAHVHVATAALEHGCAVFVEKPVSTTVADLDGLMAVGARVQRPILGSALWSWDPTVDALAALVAEGQLGTLLRVEGARQNLGCLKAGHDVIDDLLPHDLQILRRLTGRMPDRVRAWGSRLAHTSAIDSATVHLQWAGSLEAELRLSWVAPEKVRRMTLIGTQAMAVLDPLHGTAPLRVLRATPADAARPEPITLRDVWAPSLPAHTTEPLLAQCAETLICVRGAPPRLPLVAHREVAAVLEAARDSVRRGGVEVSTHGR